MKNLSDEEMKKLYESVYKAMDDLIGKYGVMAKPYTTNLPSAQHRGQFSPTDCEARGMYSYQEPEVDEQGTFYGYKVLLACCDGRCGIFNSPRYKNRWNDDGKLTADREPSEHTMFGIHCTKRMNHPELGSYFTHQSSVLVRCALFGTIVETEQGFRAQHAQIIGVYENGNWTSHQDYQERARNYSRSNPIEEVRWTKGWRTYTGFDSQP